VKPNLLPLMCCPQCRGDLQLTGINGSNEPLLNGRLACQRCHATFSIESGLPVMLTKETLQTYRASSTAAKPLTGAKAEFSKLLKLTRPPDPYASGAALMKIKSFLAGVTGGNILNIGGGEQDLGPRVISLDIAQANGVDIIADAHKLPFCDRSIDAVICTAVLEHVWDPYLAVTEIYRVLKKGGRVYIELPFIYAYHPAAGTEMDYTRYTEAGTRRLMNKFKMLELGAAAGPGVGLISIMREYGAELLNCWHSRNFLRELTGNFLGWILLPWRWLDPLLKKKKSLASVYYYLGEKVD
jgi:uncharacterized protein YbaR (Trm112 family)